MNKYELLSQMENAKNNYLLVLAACSLFSNDKTYPILEESFCSFGSYSFHFKQVADMMKIKGDREIACKEFIKMGLRTIVKEMFELIRDYCVKTRQENIFKGKIWYQFSRLIRNCLSHNFKFEFRLHDKKILPVVWKGKEINISMDNTFLELSFFGYIEAWTLF